MDTLPHLELCMRLGAALLIGAVFGIERHLHDQAAGLRTHVLVALASALAVLMVAARETVASGIALEAQSRVLQGVLTGVGFIGAGVILHSPQGHKIHGLTTAAAIWITAAFGALCGAGQFEIAVLGFFGAALVLAIGGPIERALYRRFGRIPEKDTSEEPLGRTDERR